MLVGYRDQPGGIDRLHKYSQSTGYIRIVYVVKDVRYIFQFPGHRQFQIFS